MKKATGGDNDGLPKLTPCRIQVSLQKAVEGQAVDSLITLAGDPSKPYGETNPFLATIEKAE